MDIRRAARDDIPAVVETITEAFQLDPVWGWAFPYAVARPAQYRQWWRLFIASAMRYDWTWLADEGAAVAVWIPPGGAELTDEEDAAVEPLLRSLIGSWTDTVLDGLHGFDAARPREEPHYYLSLLGTRDDRRGEGIGMALLNECLTVIDAERAPAYLESTNPLNNRRYERAGFAGIGTFAMPDGGPVVTRMWSLGRAERALVASGGQWPRKASASHQEGWPLVTLASMSIGRSRRAASQDLTGARSAGSRTVAAA